MNCRCCPNATVCAQRWRPFCNQFEGIVEDFNYGTLLRLDCEKDYSEVNTIFGEWECLSRPNGVAKSRN